MTPSATGVSPRILAASAALALATIACESKSSTSTGPSPVKCQVFLEAPSSSIEPAGGRSVVAVSAQPECAWTAAADAPWITALTPSSGQGNGTIEFQADPNPAATTRQGHIAVNNQQVSVEQQPAPCRFEVSPGTATVGADGGTITVRVTTLAGCRWEARTDVGWASLSGSGGEGSGTISVAVAPSGGAGRSGTLLVAGQTVTVIQSASGPASPNGPESSNCVFSLERTSETVSAAGGSLTVGVSGAADCPRTASSQMAWITIVAGATGAGSGAVTFTVAPNSGAARTGTVTIAGQQFTVEQAAAAAAPGGCTYAINPTEQAISEQGGSITVAVSAGAGCAWGASSNDSWIVIRAGASGSGNGTVRFDVAAQAQGSRRKGTLTIAGLTFTVDQNKKTD
jgi:hypothetical protein